MMKVGIKKLSAEAKIPAYAKPGDAAVDLYAIREEFDAKMGTVIYGTGLAVSIPEGHVGLLFPRSSVCNTTLMLTNSVGVIDSGYRGEIKVVMRSVRIPGIKYKAGDRIAQLMIVPIPSIEFEETELDETDRGDGGFGSTGNK